MSSFGVGLGNFTAGLLDYIGLGENMRKEILNTDRNANKVFNLEKQLAALNEKYQNKIDYYNAALDLFTGIGLPIPSQAMSKIADKRQEILKKRDELIRNKDLVQDYGNLAVKALDTSNLTTAYDQDFYDRKEQLSNDIKESINEKVSKDLETRL